MRVPADAVLPVAGRSPAVPGPPTPTGGGLAPLLVVVDESTGSALADLPRLALRGFLLVAIPTPGPGLSLNAALHWWAARGNRALRAAVVTEVHRALSGCVGRYRVLDLPVRVGVFAGRGQTCLWVAARRLADRHGAVLLVDWPAPHVDRGSRS